jgi:acyl carrier protein
MNKTIVLSQVTDIFRDILDDENIVLTYETKSGDIDGWDSLAHIQLAFTIEKYFGIKFSSEGIFRWKNVGEMIEDIIGKIENVK